MKSHGNSKNDTPFHPTWPSTRQKIKEKCLAEGPKHVVSLVSADAGGVLEASAPGRLPRDEKQVSNFKSRVPSGSRLSSVIGLSRDAAADDLFIVMQKAFTEDPSKKFVRAVNAAPEPAVVVATDRQLQDLARFCTSTFEFTILTVDPTFSLGAFDVTLITFRQLQLQSKRFKQPPVLVGPACVHFKKSFSTYLFFASTVIGQCRELEGVRALGTDGEQALVDAFKHEFGYAQHLTCFIHVRRNVKDKLREYNMPTQLSIEILDDVFGNKVGTVYVEGLVDAEDTDDFDAKIESLLTKWRNMELTSTCDIEGFIGWFRSYKAPVIRRSMIRPLREECGLGSPPVPFTTNACETANFVLKHKVNYQRNELPEFLGKFSELVSEQQCEVDKAVIGRGKYELRSQYRSWHVPETKWFVMSTAQREQHLKRFAGASLSDIVQSDGETRGSTAPICFGRDSTFSSSLSVDIHTFADAVRVPLNCLQGIWNKAAELLKTDAAIVPAPGVGDDAKFVLSYRGKRPHLVMPKKGGGFACDADCPNWKALGICAHSVAVAELCKKLPDYIEKFTKAKRTPSLTKFAEATMPKGRGKKGSQCPRKRKASTAIETRVRNPAMAFSAPNVPPQIDQGVLSVNVSQSTSAPLPSQATFQLNNNSNVLSSWPYGSSTMPLVSPQLPPAPAWPYSPYSASACFSSPPSFFNQPFSAPPPSTSFAPPGSTPFAPPGSTPFAPPGSTPFAPPGSTPFTSPGSTPFAPPGSTPFASPPSTPFAPPSTPFAPSLSTQFTLCHITGNISVCAGCRNKYSKNATAPEDMCIKHQEWREYTPQGTRVPQSRYGNAYYHFDPHCIWLRCNWFVPSHLEIPPNVLSELGPSHKSKLRMLFNIDL